MNPPPAPALSAHDTAFLHAFENLVLPPESFRHADHLRAAWCCLRISADFATGASRFIASFRRFVTHAGASAKYHETITWFYLALIAERIAAAPGATWEEFRTANPDLFDHTMPRLKASYRPGTLQSHLARRVFVLPDAAA